MIWVPKMSTNITESENRRNVMIGRNMTELGEKRARDHGERECELAKSERAKR